ncbi:unnamed protein product [marine sediment metagenome]|uniref:4Fe-4S ferredoxin-type domain-containing protein n=1 Tax=marine sediment metagenome TaxID=412755 RepID=X1BMJ9_9ZZZZ
MQGKVIMKNKSVNNKSIVYFTEIKKDSNKSLIERLAIMIDRSKLFKNIKSHDRVAIKTHFGERGGHAYIRTPFIGKIVSKVKEYGGIPFVTDANTLYSHKRHNAIDHLETAAINGFTPETVGAPIIIADGLIGKDHEVFKINGNHFKEIYIASTIFHSDFIIVATHFTGHPLGGFGGSIKNLAMGCASIKGKFLQHSEYLPKVKEGLCNLCGVCIENCGYNAIKKGKNSIYFIAENCVGCGECVSVCKYGAISPKYPNEGKKLQEKMVEYTMGIKKQKKEKIIYINFLIDISPGCDCCSFSNAPIVHDLGVLLSDDPVAVDKASVDLINDAPYSPLWSTVDKFNDQDKFRAIYQDIDWNWQLNYGQQMGIGNKEYKIVKV